MNTIRIVARNLTVFVIVAGCGAAFGFGAGYVIGVLDGLRR